MDLRQALHALLDDLPDSDLPAVSRFLEQLRRKAANPGDDPKTILLAMPPGGEDSDFGRIRDRGRLERECAKLDPAFEREMADEGPTEDLAGWPES